MEKIETSRYQNNTLVVGSLGLPSAKIRKGIFKLMETLDIKKMDVWLFARENLNRCYEYLAMAKGLNRPLPVFNPAQAEIQGDSP